VEKRQGRPGVRMCVCVSSRLDRWTGIRSPTASVSHSLIYPTRVCVAHRGGLTALHTLKDYYMSLLALGANGKCVRYIFIYLFIYLFGLFYKAETFWFRFRQILNCSHFLKSFFCFSSEIRWKTLAKAKKLKRLKWDFTSTTRIGTMPKNK